MGVREETGTPQNSLIKDSSTWAKQRATACEQISTVSKNLWHREEEAQVADVTLFKWMQEIRTGESLCLQRVYTHLKKLSPPLNAENGLRPADESAEHTQKQIKTSQPSQGLWHPPSLISALTSYRPFPSPSLLPPNPALLGGGQQPGLMVKLCLSAFLSIHLLGPSSGSKELKLSREKPKSP